MGVDEEARFQQPQPSSGRTVERRPLFVLTGFLGSGKTTLLSRFLGTPAGLGTAVLINELGEVALDHLLLERLEADVSLLPAGCACCVVGGALEGAILRALEHRPQRLVIETTGLADPAPILHAIATSPIIRARVELAGVIVVLDAARGAEVIDAQLEGRLQLDFADRVVLSKLDLAHEAPVAGLRARLAADHPSLPVVDGDDFAAAFAPLGIGDADRARLWLQSSLPAQPHDAQSRVIELPSPVDAEALQLWLSMVTMIDGMSLLRIKGLVETPEGLLVLQSAQRACSPPRRLASQPPGWHGSRLVLIARGMSAATLDRLVLSALEAASGQRRAH